jgi:ParB/RepB/Spo0J family partition protein
MSPKKSGKNEIPFVEGLKVTEVLDIPLEELKEDRTFQYRLSANIGDLKSSLQQEGQREPIDLTGSKPYRIIDGFRRVEASRALGWTVIKALVHKGITDEEAHKVAFIKNVVRKNLSPMDKANAIFQAKQRGMKSGELEEYFGLSEKQLKRYEALLDFPGEIQKLLEKETIPMGHAKVLADFKVKDLPSWLKMITEDGLTAKQLKRELKKNSGAKAGGKTKLYMKKDKGGFRMYPFSVSKDASQAEKDKVMKVLQEAMEMLKG